MKKFICLLLLCLLCASAFPQLSKPRTIVTTDGELDDVDSFISLLLHANEFKIEGLIISSSMCKFRIQ